MADQPGPTPQLLRTDMQAMLSYIQGARIVSMARETAISRLKGWLLGRFWVGVASALLAMLAAWVIWGDGGDSHAPLVSALVLIMLASRLGAITSIGRRMNDDNLGIGVGDDSILTLASLGSGRNGLALALLTSNVFGIVIFALFASGVPAALGMVGGIAPTFRDVALSPLQAKADADAALVSRRKKDEIAACAAPPPKTGAGATGAAAATGGEPGAGPAVNSSAPATAGPAARNGQKSGQTPPTTVAPPPGGNAATPAAAAPALACAAATLVRKEAEDAAALSKAALEAMAKTTATDGSSADKWFGKLATALGLLTVPDLFKLLIWAFIAGFAEQLVPDMLDSIANRAKAAQQKQGIVPVK
jgi:hypothetical protein